MTSSIAITRQVVSKMVAERVRLDVHSLESMLGLLDDFMTTNKEFCF